MNKQGFIEILIPCLIVGLAAAVGIGYTLWTKKPDNAVEEICEEVIKEETGVDIDLTPKSIEKKA